MRQKVTSYVITSLLTFFFLGALFIKVSAQGNALNFDGTNDHVVIGSAAGLYPAGSAYTKEAWIIRESYASPQNIISSIDPFWIEFTEQLNASNSYIIPGQEHFDVVDPAIMYSNRWTHVAVTFDGASTMKLYKNGMLVSTNTTVPHTSGSGQNYIGAFLNTVSGLPDYTFRGSIDEVRVYNIALTQAQIQSDMTSAVSAAPANLLAYYDFNSGVAGGNNTGLTTLTDNSGNANHGTLVNFANTGSGSNWIGSYATIIPVATAASSINTAGFTANWATPNGGNASNIDWYFLDVSTTPDFSNPIAGSPFLKSFGQNSETVTGLNAATTYYYRVWADKGFSFQGAYSNVVSVTTSGVLPVNLYTFNVSKSSAGNVLQWTTASEINSSYFELERSENNRDYKFVQKITAAGNSSTLKNYQYNDITGFAPVYYYRLKQVDADGKWVYSSTVLIKNASDGAVTVYPNPVRDRFVINITDRSLLNTSAVLTDINGRFLQRIPVIQTATTVDASSYPAGVYLLRLNNGEVTKLIKE